MTSEELLENDGIDNCAFIITAVAATVINAVCQVVITVCIVVIVYHVLKWFFSWISGTRISYRNVEKVVEETRVVTTPAIMINGFRYETVAKTKEEIETLVKTKTKTADDKEEYVYYLAFSAGIAYDGVSSDNTIEPNGLYIGPEISFEQACGILTSQIYTTCEHDGISFSYIPSIYSYWEYGVLDVLNQPNVGYHPNTLYGCPESHNGGLYHYHPFECYYVAIPFLKNGREVSKNYRPHAFFIGHNVSGYLTY